MTVLSPGAQSRRGGRGPGWLLLTALLVLAILASATLVFTNKVELLRLAVILSLWAAVMAAFVTVVYRRQSEVAQARARDMKFVYDLQLDREISARREYELSVEAQLRRQVGAQAADEMSALRAELASLRSQLEVMLGTDLGHRPALESDRASVSMSGPLTVPLSAVPMPVAPDRVESSRVTMVLEQYLTYEDVVVESPILDVPEEPLAPAPEERPLQPPAEQFAQEARGSHWRPAPEPVAPEPVTVEEPYFEPVEQYAPPPRPQPEAPWRPPEARLGRHATDGAQSWPEPAVAAEPERGRHGVPPQAQPPAEPEGQHAAGQSLSDLLSKLDMSGQVRAGGRRRRDD